MLALVYIGIVGLWLFDCVVLFLGAGIAVKPPDLIFSIPLGQLRLNYNLVSLGAPPLTIFLVVFMFRRPKPKNSAGVVEALAYYALILVGVALFSLFGGHFSRLLMKENATPQIAAVYLTMGLGSLLTKHEWLAQVEVGVRAAARGLGKFTNDAREDQAGETVNFLTLLTAVVLGAIVIPSLVVLSAQLMGLQAAGPWNSVFDTLLQYIVVLTIALGLAEAFATRLGILPHNTGRRLRARVNRYTRVLLLSCALSSFGFAMIMAVEGHGSLLPWQPSSVWPVALLLAIVPALLSAVHVFLRSDGQEWAGAQPRAILFIVTGGGMFVAGLVVQLARAQIAGLAANSVTYWFVALLWASVGVIIAAFVKPPQSE